MNIIETIKKRRSVRTYSPAPLSEQQIEELRKIIKSSSSPFGGNVTIDLDTFDEIGPVKMGTYGFVSGARNYLVAAAGGDDDSLLSLGYRFEQVVLGATEMGLGTCWLGATYRSSVFEHRHKWSAGESLRIVSPVGIPAPKTLKERFIRFSAGSDKRKPFGSLFFSDDFSSPLEETDKFGLSLEMLRLAPSSTNSQPWRTVVRGDKVHFYYVPRTKFALIDMGIGLCHLALAEKEQGFEGSFAKDPSAPKPEVNLVYLTSWSRS